MTLTKAQDELLRQLEKGFRVTFQDEYYVVFNNDEAHKIWPSTFYGLYDQKMVEKDWTGNYTISEFGREQISGK